MRQDCALRILTYNIHKGFTVGNARFVLHQMRDQLRQVDVDVVFLQEIQGAHHVRSARVADWPDESQFEFLADTIWPHYTYGKNAIYHAGHHGNAILSKYPFTYWENFNVSSMRAASRSVLHGVIEYPPRSLRVHLLCIHFDLVAFERERQLRVLNEHIHHHVPRDEPVIIAGDFNDWRSAADRHISEDLNLNEIFRQMQGRHARTYPAWMPVFPLDRIYYRNLAPVECDCLQHAPWHRLSDHAPLYAGFDLLNRNK